MSDLTPAVQRRVQFLTEHKDTIRELLLKIGVLIKDGTERGVIKNADDLTPIFGLVENRHLFSSLFDTLSHGEINSVLPLLPSDMRKKAKKALAALALLSGDDE